MAYALQIKPSGAGTSSSAFGSRAPLRSPVTSRHSLCLRQTVCFARKGPEEKEASSSVQQKLSGSVAAVLAASLLLGSAAFPDSAEAARSGGRVGGSSFRSSAPRAAPRSAPRSSGPSVRNYNYNMAPAPPLIGGYGYGGYGYGGGMSLFPSFVPVYGFGGGIFQFFIVAFIASTVLGGIRNLVNRRRDDDFDD